MKFIIDTDAIKIRAFETLVDNIADGATEERFHELMGTYLTVIDMIEDEGTPAEDK